MSIRSREFIRHGLSWPTGTSDLTIAFHLIRKGGYVTDPDGNRVGASLFTLYREVQSLLWPEDDHHEWSDLILRTILANRITTVQGPKDSSKTRSIAKFALVDYHAFPATTLILISSTQIRSLELRVWGDLKSLYNRAKEVWPEAPGNVVDSLHGIFTDSVGEDVTTARDIRRGIICIPVKDSEGQWQGMDRWVGIKQKRRRVLADETQFYASPFLSTFANLDKGDFKAVLIGNPKGEGDPLDKVGEPKDGWGSEGEITKTTTWKNKWGGTTIQLYGPDSPAIRHPGKYEYLTDQDDIDRIIQRYGKESAEYWMQGVGIRPQGMSARRVITREMVREFGGKEPVVWGTKPTTKVYAIDASYGGDRCVGGSIEFGLDINNVQVIAFNEPVIIPIRLYPKSVPEDERLLPEDQIAVFAKVDCGRQSILPQNLFYDATGKGSLGTAFARHGFAAVNPMEFGGKPTTRPVCADEFILDPKTKQRRLKRADEHYSKLVTELYYSCRFALECRQIRQLPESVEDEWAAREWTTVWGYKKELEPKDKCKERLGRSPDFGDWAVIAVEGARRLGFVISKMESSDSQGADDGWKDDIRRRVASLKRSYTLTYR